jgi:hypothetical protein
MPKEISEKENVSDYENFRAIVSPTTFKVLKVS